MAGYLTVKAYLHIAFLIVFHEIDFNAFSNYLNFRLQNTAIYTYGLGIACSEAIYSSIRSFVSLETVCITIN